MPTEDKDSKLVLLLGQVRYCVVLCRAQRAACPLRSMRDASYRAASTMQGKTAIEVARPRPLLPSSCAQVDVRTASVVVATKGQGGASARRRVVLLTIDNGSDLGAAHSCSHRPACEVLLAYRSISTGYHYASAAQLLSEGLADAWS
jgi:hypothetical protein